MTDSVPKLLAKLELTGVPRAEPGIPQVELTFDVEEDGVFRISIESISTGYSQQIRIRPDVDISLEITEGLSGLLK